MEKELQVVGFRIGNERTAFVLPPCAKLCAFPEITAVSQRTRPD